MSLYESLKQLTLRVLPRRVLLPLKKLHYAHVLGGSAADDPEFSVLANLVHAGDIVMDLGASIGTYTKLLSKLVGTYGTVYSVEPIPPTYEILCYNTRRYHLKNVKPIRVAVSDRVGVVDMEVPLYSWGGENYYDARIVDQPINPSCQRFAVSSTTIDSIRGGPVHFIKCVTPGHEDAAIRGATRTIEQFQPAWLVLVYKRELLKKMHDLGYGVFWFDGTVLRHQKDSDRPIKSFFFTQSHLTILRQEGQRIV